MIFLLLPPPPNYFGGGESIGESLSSFMRESFDPGPELPCWSPLLLWDSIPKPAIPIKASPPFPIIIPPSKGPGPINDPIFPFSMPPTPLGLEWRLFMMGMSFDEVEDDEEEPPPLLEPLECDFSTGK